MFCGVRFRKKYFAWDQHAFPTTQSFNHLYDHRGQYFKKARREKSDCMVRSRSSWLYLARPSCRSRDARIQCCIRSESIPCVCRMRPLPILKVLQPIQHTLSFVVSYREKTRPWRKVHTEYVAQWCFRGWPIGENGSRGNVE